MAPTMQNIIHQQLRRHTHLGNPTHDTTKNNINADTLSSSDRSGGEPSSQSRINDLRRTKSDRGQYIKSELDGDTRDNINISMEMGDSHTHPTPTTSHDTMNNNNANSDIHYMDLKEPAPDAVLTQQQQDEENDALIDEYELEIERLKNLNATLSANVATLTTAALNGGGSSEHVQIVPVEVCQNCAAGHEIDESFSSQPGISNEIYNDMILTEEHYMNEITKLQKKNNKLDQKLEHKKKLVSQLSLNLKTAAEKISEFGKERDEWKAKYEQLERAKQQPYTLQQQTKKEDESIHQIHKYQVQVLQNELTSLLRTMNENKNNHAYDRQQLLNVYRSDDAMWNKKMERPEDTLQRVMRHLRSEDEGTVGIPPVTTDTEDNRSMNVIDESSSSRGVNIWDSVTSIFGGPSQQQQKHQHELQHQQQQQQLQQQQREMETKQVDAQSTSSEDSSGSSSDSSSDSSSHEESEEVDDMSTGKIMATLQIDTTTEINGDSESERADNSSSIPGNDASSSHSTTNASVGNAPQAVERVKSDLDGISPQDYFITSILQARGYPGTTCSSLSCGYHNSPTTYQTLSYGVALTKAIRSSDIETVRSLLDSGLHPNACNQFGESILHAACRRGDVGLVQALLEAGASVQVDDDFGRTPLHDSFWTASPNLDMVRLLLDQDPWLLCLTDSRGSAPLEYVRKEHWGVWIGFLEDIADLYWPDITCQQDENEMSNNRQKVPPLSIVEPNSCPLPDPKNNLDLKVIELLANGSITPQDLENNEEAIKDADISNDSSVNVDVSPSDEAETAEKAQKVEPDVLEEPTAPKGRDFSVDDSDTALDLGNEENDDDYQGDAWSVDGVQSIEEAAIETTNTLQRNEDSDTAAEGSSAVERNESEEADSVEKVNNTAVPMSREAEDSTLPLQKNDLDKFETSGLDSLSSENAEQSQNEQIAQCGEVGDGTDSGDEFQHTIAEIDESSVGELIEKGHDYNYDTDDDDDDDDYVAKEPKNKEVNQRKTNDDGSVNTSERIASEDSIEYTNPKTTEVERSGDNNAKDNPDEVVASPYPEEDVESESHPIANSNQEMDSASQPQETSAAEDDAVNSQECLANDDETHNELGDIPTSINFMPGNVRSDATVRSVLTMATTTTAITDGTQARITSYGEEKQLSNSLATKLEMKLEMVKEKSKARLDGTDEDRSVGYYHNVISQYTKDPTLSNRLSRKELFQRQGSLDLFVDVVNDVFHSPEDRVVLVASKDNDKYVVPRYQAPALPPESKKGAPSFKKGYKDGYYMYKSSSGNEYVGHWKDGRRHGFGRAKYRDGEVFSGQWERGRRHGHGTLHLANSEVFDGDWQLNKKHGLGIYYWTDGEVDISWYENDARLESVRWTSDRRRAYILDLASSKKEPISLVKAANIVKGWEVKSQTFDC